MIFSLSFSLRFILTDAYKVDKIRIRFIDIENARISNFQISRL